eukprot:TRINITY_DN63728_c0_g1_i1.p1 TRINITY_DN63728_c0_g1~~TRINITY_DN63728_c0_g1_i1.p1  ORF type:complete len:517 (+),score=95.78 TRINITY_DN63728_c0_g1_i1:28-1551(+)
MHRAKIHSGFSAVLRRAPHRLVGGLQLRSRPAFFCLEITQKRSHTVLLAPGLGDAIAAIPGASRDKQGHITVPVPDIRLDLLAKLERTHPVPAKVEVVEIARESMDEFVSAVGERLSAVADPAELSGKLLSELRASSALVLAVPCHPVDDDSVKWLQNAETALISADLQALEQQVCKQGAVGEDSELDEAKLRKALSNSKDPTIKRDADDLLKTVLAPGLNSLRSQLRAGLPARVARAGLEGQLTRSGQYHTLDPRFEDLARAWLNAIVTWKPLLVLADVPEADAGDAASTSDQHDASSIGNSSSQTLQLHVEKQGIPCLTACVTLENESAALAGEPEFLKEYLESCGLTDGSQGGPSNTDLRPWRSQSAKIVEQIPRLLNQLTYYTAGEKEARAWMCPRVRKDGSALPFSLLSQGQPSVPQDKTGKGGSSQQSEGVPASLASRAIHTSFESRVKNVLLWKFEDLEGLGISDSGPGAKERARAKGLMKKVSGQHLLLDGDVVEFDLK